MGFKIYNGNTTRKSITSSSSGFKFLSMPLYGEQKPNQVIYVTANIFLGKLLSGELEKDLFMKHSWYENWWSMAKTQLNSFLFPLEIMSDKYFISNQQNIFFLDCRKRLVIWSGQRWWSHLPVPNFDGNLSTFTTWRLSFFRTIYQIAHQLCYRWKTLLDHGIR